MDKLYQWKTLKPNSPFAPVLDLPIWVDELDETLTYKILNSILHKEEDIIPMHWTEYNIFTWPNVSLSVLKQEVRRMHDEFLSALNLPVPKELWINGWVYPQKKGMILKRHNHAIHENSYLSANIVLTRNETTTDFDIPYISANDGLFELENKMGRIAFFPSYVPHSVKELKDDSRYTIGIDIITKEGMEQFRSNNNNPLDPLHRAVKL